MRKRRFRGASNPGVDLPVDLTVDLGALLLANPVVAASGTFGHGAEVAALCDPRGIGAVTTKLVVVKLAARAEPGAANSASASAANNRRSVIPLTSVEAKNKLNGM